VLLCGCAKKGADKPVAKKKENVGSAVVDVITQRDAIKAGQGAKRQIHAVVDKRDEQLDEVLK